MGKSQQIQNILHHFNSVVENKGEKSNSNSEQQFAPDSMYHLSQDYLSYKYGLHLAQQISERTQVICFDAKQCFFLTDLNIAVAYASLNQVQEAAEQLLSHDAIPFQLGSSKQKDVVNILGFVIDILVQTGNFKHALQYANSFEQSIGVDLLMLQQFQFQLEENGNTLVHQTIQNREKDGKEPSNIIQKEIDKLQLDLYFQQALIGYYSNNQRKLYYSLKYASQIRTVHPDMLRIKALLELSKGRKKKAIKILRGLLDQFRGDEYSFKQCVYFQGSKYIMELILCYEVGLLYSLSGKFALAKKYFSQSLSLSLEFTQHQISAVMPKTPKQSDPGDSNSNDNSYSHEYDGNSTEAQYWDSEGTCSPTDLYQNYIDQIQVQSTYQLGLNYLQRGNFEQSFKILYGLLGHMHQNACYWLRLGESVLQSYLDLKERFQYQYNLELRAQDSEILNGNQIVRKVIVHEFEGQYIYLDTESNFPTSFIPAETSQEDDSYLSQSWQGKEMRWHEYQKTEGLVNRYHVATDLLVSTDVDFAELCFTNALSIANKTISSHQQIQQPDKVANQQQSPRTVQQLPDEEQVLEGLTIDTKQDQQQLKQQQQLQSQWQQQQQQKQNGSFSPAQSVLNQLPLQEVDTIAQACMTNLSYIYLEKKQEQKVIDLNIRMKDQLQHRNGVYQCYQANYLGEAYTLLNSPTQGLNILSTQLEACQQQDDMIPQHLRDTKGPQQNSHTPQSAASGLKASFLNDPLQSPILKGQTYQNDNFNYESQANSSSNPLPTQAHANQVSKESAAGSHFGTQNSIYGQQQSFELYGSTKNISAGTGWSNGSNDGVENGHAHGNQGGHYLCQEDLLAQFYSNIGCILLALGSYEQATLNLKQAQQLQPACKQVAQNMIWLQLYYGNERGILDAIYAPQVYH